MPSGTHKLLAASDSIHFALNGEVRAVRDINPTKTVLYFLREDLGKTGTKEGCAEGDCGACTVVIGELNGYQLELKTVNACLQFVPTLDGKALFTVEHLPARRQFASRAGSDGRVSRFTMRVLHPWLHHVSMGTLSRTPAG
jgi:xanthine dehydrogenase iron-sulfur cluster and FAD-binding subunit A